MFKKLVFLLLESKRVILIFGKNIFNTIPGNPAPDPISIKLLIWFKSIDFVTIKESKKCLMYTSSFFVIAVMLVCSLYWIKKL